jgi:hypothetical protein
MQRDDVRMAQLGEQVGLPLEPRLEIVVAGDSGIEEFECVLAGQPRMLHQENLPHPAGAELADDAVPRDLGDAHRVIVAGARLATASISASWSSVTACNRPR